MEKKFKKVLPLISIFSIVTAATLFYRIFEPISVDNFAINLTKRIAAETGGFVTKIYDPYKEKRIEANLGPDITEKLLSSKISSKDFNSVFKENNYLKEHLKIVDYDNEPIIKSNFGFDYQPYNEEKLGLLRKKYNPDKIVSPAKNNFEKILLIRDWVNSRWEFGIPRNISYNFNAIDILERAERGERFFCSEYATTYIQLLASFGITARYVGLFKGHAVAEVWSEDYNKWVVIDPTFNLYYEMDGIPINALELHNAWVHSDWRKVNVVFGDNGKKTEKYPFNLIDYYKNFFVRMRNDWFTNLYPRWHPKSNSIMNSLEWSDRYTKNEIRIANETNRIEDLYWSLNQVYITIVNYNVLRDKIVLTLYLDTLTPNFEKFSIRLNGGKDIVNTIQPAFEWKLHKGLNSLKVTPINKFGIEGKPTIISISYN